MYSSQKANSFVTISVAKLLACRLSDFPSQNSCYLHESWDIWFKKKKAKILISLGYISTDFKTF